MRKLIIILFLFTFYIANVNSQTWTYYTNNWGFGMGQGGGQGNPIIVDYYGNLWVAPIIGIQRGLWKYDIGLDQWISFSNVFSNKAILSMYADTENSYWITVFNEIIYHFDGNNVIRHYTTA